MKPHKYGAKAVVIDGIRFASQAEGRRYAELKLLEKASQIRGLVVQPKLPLRVPVYASVESERADGVALVGWYRPDFRYKERHHGEWRTVWEDVKGVRTAVYRLKKRIVETQFGIEIREVVT